ncbi:type II secretion system F family protein [Corynebacterium lizhenjunii]|uniref:type II secretion system F family protein n=1 Tax=Corynebacterium lizhenjunii TaxID=2709394 RepID=UPI0013E9D867|nr:type II secretion system F family protein [Corynebacterium lizhenjunii]
MSTLTCGFDTAQAGLWALALMLAAAAVLAGTIDDDRPGHHPRGPKTPRASPATQSPGVVRPRGLRGRLETLARRVATPTPNYLVAAHDVELFSACLQAGLGPARAAAAVAETSTYSAWADTAALLALGVEAHQAWQPLRAVPGLGDVAALVVMSESSGAAIVTGCGRLSKHLRQQAEDLATTRAERAGVLIALPLALCFLPAFIVMGLVPIIAGLVGQMF